MNSAPICSDIHSVSFDLLKASEVKKLSVCNVTSTTTFESTGESKMGGLHDLRMGPLNNRDFCGTCGNRNDCPGHIGHIELELPVFHPLFLNKLVKILKCSCWHCCCIRLSKKVCYTYIKRFEQIKNHSDFIDQNVDVNMSCDDTTNNITSDSYSLETWEEIKREFLDRASKQTSCSSCGNAFRGKVRESQLGIGITLSWPEGSKPPVSLGSTWSADLLTENYASDSNDDDENVESEKSSKKKNSKIVKRSYDDDFTMNIPQEAKTHTKQGKGMIVQHFQAFQIVPIIKSLWENNRKIFEYLFPIGKTLSWEMFFMFVIPVPANKFRPLGMSVGRNIQLLHPRTSGLLDILTANDRLKFYIDLQRKEENKEINKDSNNDNNTNEIKEEFEMNSSNLISYVSTLQEKINTYLDQNKSFKPSAALPGIRQWLEKKAGIIRQKMMGKRVNYSARTVIGPDPYLDTNEIGIPLMFALNLTIPERVGTHNVSLLSKLVENGSNLYPGANKLLLNGILYDLSRLDQNQRKAKSRLLLSSVLSASNPFLINHHPIVYRHLIDGDLVLMNRQPTLHRPSIMAHYIRIQPKDNIMRLNYVNCGTYNADFDGDEMNLHLPQSLFSRSEAKYIMDASRQYSVPKSGEPLRGLIQDSCIGGAFLTSKSTFLTKEQYFHLLYTSLSFIIDKKSSALSTNPMIHSSKGQVIFGSNERFSEVNSPLGKVKIDESILRDQFHSSNKSLNKISFTNENLNNTSNKFNSLNSQNLNFLQSGNQENIKYNSNNLPNGLILEPPTLLKPCLRWTGKQVITSLLKTILYCLVSTNPDIYAGVNLTSKSRTPGDSWNGKEDGETEEAVVIIRNSELLQGVIDKNQIGSNSYCLVHLCTELVGPLLGGKLLSALFNLSQVYLQMRGFTCSISDMLLTSKAETERINLIRRYNHASVLIQEAFSHYIFKEVGGKNDLINHTYFDEKYDTYKTIESNDYHKKQSNIIEKLREIKKNRLLVDNSQFKDIENELVRFSTDNNLLSNILEILIEKLKEITQGNNKNQNKNLLLELIKTMKECKIGVKSIFKEELLDQMEDIINDIDNNSKNQHSTILYDTSWLSLAKVDDNNEDQMNEEENEFNDEIGKFFVYPNELTRRKLESLIGSKLSTKKDSLLKIMDAISKIGLGDITSKLGNLLKGSSSKFPFPNNGFSSMVLTGAKGSRVNYNMICVMLGQQELEGRRVPIMTSMKTLPSFASYDLGSRAGGLITDRYLDGLHAQEFFFHCMSGREGLVDTAVKTARSGYLQRCILKGLESMIVHYDGTVRSEDDTIVQFMYGDDGIDVSKSSYLTRLDDLVINKSLLIRDVNFDESMRNKFLKKSFKNVFNYENKQNIFKTCLNQEFNHQKSNKLRKMNEKNGINDSVESKNNSNHEEVKEEEDELSYLKDIPINSILPTILNGGSVSESFLKSLSESNIHRLTKLCNPKITKTTNKNNKRKTTDSTFNNNKYDDVEYKEMLDMERLLRLKYMKTQISPGEAVGCLAAQSIGEPATQMTLNTFHLAGHGAANVTLGIPRLKELLQTGGDSKTPYIFVPLLNNKKDKKDDDKNILGYTEKVLDCFKSIPLSDIIENVGVESSIVYDSKGLYEYSSSNSTLKKSTYCWNYEVSIKFSDLHLFCQCLPQFTISYLINLTLSKCIKPFLRHVNNMFTLSSIKSNKICIQENDEVDEFITKYVLGQNSDRNIGIYKGALSSLVQKGNLSQVGGSNLSGRQDEDDFDNVSTQKKETKDEDDNNVKKGDLNDMDMDNFEVDENEKVKDEDDNSSIESSSSTSEEENDRDDFDDDKKNDDEEIDNENDDNDEDEDENDIKEKSKIYNQSSLENTNIPSINLKILTKPLLKHVTDIDIDKKTNILKINIGWPVKLCPHYIDFLPVLKSTISKANIQSISSLKNARITRNQKVDDDQLSQFELTVEGTNVGHIYRISPKYVKHDKIRFNDIQTVYKYYGVEAARQCIINELRNVFSVYGINVDYRHLTLISDSVTSSGQLRVFNRMGAISHNISPFLQMSFETSMKFLTEACLRNAIDNLKSPASSISVGRIVSVGTGISRTFTNFEQSKEKSRDEGKKENRKDSNYFKFL